MERVQKVCRGQGSRSVTLSIAHEKYIRPGSNWCLIKELWNIFHELDSDNNGHLDADELTVALRKAGEPRVPLLSCGDSPQIRRSPCRRAGVPVDTVRLYDLPHVIPSSTLDKLSRVS